MAAQLQIKNVAHADVDDTEETLVPSLELALVEDLYGYDRRVFHSARILSERIALSRM